MSTYLSNFIFTIGVLAIYNGIQCFIPQMRLTHRIYARKPAEATPLMSRMMGLWTITSATIRIYASYTLSNPVSYHLCMATFMFALFSFTMEVFIFKTAPISSPGVFPAMLISCRTRAIHLCPECNTIAFGLAWMASSYSSYIPGN